MAQLRISLDGKEVNHINLLKGREYIVGRNESCDIVLNKSSVSRQHLKLSFDGQSWQIQAISKFSSMLLQGEEKQQIELNQSLSFYVEGFEFKFIFEDTKLKKESNPNTYIPVPGSLLNPDASVTNAPAPVNENTKIDRTAVAGPIGEPCLLVSNEGNGEETLFTLEGNDWIVGRSSSCQIQIDEPKASRNHFEIIKTTTGFEVIDLGSSNGTLLNNERLEPQARIPLHVGDVLRVGFTIMEFQIRDPNFDAKLSEIPEHLLMEEEPSHGPITLENPPAPTPGMGYPPAAYSQNFPQVIDQQQYSGPNVVPYSPNGPALQGPKNKLMVKVAIGVLACIILYSFSKEEEGELDQTSIPGDAQKPPGSSLENLTKDQKKFLEDTHKLAKNLYIQGKYESAIIEIKKIHAMVPFYGESKDIELYSQQAIDIKIQQDDIKRREEESNAIKEKVARVVEECEQQFASSTNLTDIQACLAPALELDPENAQAQALMDKASKTEEDKQQKKLAKDAVESRVRTGNSMFQNAKNLEQSNRYLDAISGYEKYIASSLPDPQGNKTKARQALAQLRTKIKTDIRDRVTMAEKYKAEDKHKDALKTLALAIELDPQAGEARSMYDIVQEELNKKMKSLYSDSVIEENLGNIEAAKQKWRLIREQDIEGGNYYMKAARKLNRYGN